MNAIATTTSEQGQRHTAVEEFEDIAPVISAPGSYGPPILLLVGPWLLLVLLIIPPAALLLTLLLAVAAPFVAAALVGAVLATPYVLVRALRRRLASRRESSEGSVPIAHPVVQAAWATEHAGGALPATHVPWVGD
jgi:hypothetical protein